LFMHTYTPAFYTLSLHDALPICSRYSSSIIKRPLILGSVPGNCSRCSTPSLANKWFSSNKLFVWIRFSISFPASINCTVSPVGRSEEHTSELQSRENLVCRLLLE